MKTVAFSTPDHLGWRWRIVDHDGQTVEESDALFTTLDLALAEGRERLRHHAQRDAPIRLQPST